MRSRLGIVGWWLVALLVVAGCGDDTSGDGTGTAETSAGSDSGGSAGHGGSFGTSASGEAMAGRSGGGSSAGSNDVSGAPNIDPSKDIGVLTDAEKGALCDWSQGIRGGYGHETDCGNSIIIKTYDNQAQCMLVEFPMDCGLTVLEWELCAAAQVATNGCAFPSECDALLDC